VRYGVAPDHPRIKGITALRDVLDRGDIRIGNVRFGQTSPRGPEAALQRRHLRHRCDQGCRPRHPGIDAAGLSARPTSRWRADGHPIPRASGRWMRHPSP
jgi:hypothetical protein